MWLDDDEEEEVDDDDAWLLLAEPAEEVVEMMDEIAIGLGSKSTLNDMMQDAARKSWHKREMSLCKCVIRGQHVEFFLISYWHSRFNSTHNHVKGSFQGGLSI